MTTTLSHMGLRLTVQGNDVLAAKLKVMRGKVKRVRTVGVSRVGQYLYKKKRNDCLQGLYSGKEVAPNTYRFGWKYLGGPAVSHFTGATLNAHKLGRRVNSSSSDRIEVSLDTTAAPHAALIHGNIKGATEYFYNPLLKQLVKTRPWMKITQEERGEAVKLIKFTYQGRF